MPGMPVAALVPIAAITGLSSRVPVSDARAIGVLAAQSVIHGAQYLLSQCLLFFRPQRADGATQPSPPGAVGAIAGVPFALAFPGESAPPRLAWSGSLILAGVPALTVGRSR